ncbi:MAG: hypothetical protein JO257_35015 [Deltaproteobacteria bacterium]|nr:hypothetical protein [Deltaproteobacteria bacterium]
MRWLVVLLAACGSAPKPPAPVVVEKKPPPPPPKPACITPPEELASITHASGGTASVQYCIGTAVDQCFALELGSGKLTKLSTTPAAQPAGLDANAHVETTNPELKVCTGDACKTLTPQIWPGAAPLHAATNGQVAVVLLGDAEGGRGYADVYGVTTGKKLATFRYAQGDFKCGEVAMLGDTIYIGASTCQGPSGRAALFTAKGRKIAAVGGRDFGTYGNSFTQVDPTTWAFLQENGNKIALQDVVKGKVMKTIAIPQLFDPAAMGNPGESAIVRLGAGKLGVIGGTPANGSVAVVDVASGAVTVVRAPLCH